ncbi:hypothetical protein AGMMS49521_2800 [Campylobacterota bacterium]|nr:hypothetical protein AGMMS49521_2800 [Campylobacterota bacterium]
MKRQWTVKIDSKNYDINLSEDAPSALAEALDRLGANSNITTRQILELYLEACVECANLKAELGKIDTIVSAP